MCNSSLVGDICVFCLFSGIGACVRKAFVFFFFDYCMLCCVCFLGFLICVFGVIVSVLGDVFVWVC